MMKTYRATIISPTLPDGKSSGELTVMTGCITVCSGENSWTIPLDQIRISVGGASDRLVFFDPPESQRVKFYVPDRSILGEQELKNRPDVIRQRKRIESNFLFTASWLAAGLLAITLLLYAIWAGKDTIVGIVVHRIPPSWEVMLGEAVFAQTKLQYKFIDDPSVKRQLEALLSSLDKGIPDKPYPFQIHCVEDSTLNAFAIPGGHIVVHSGLILAAETPEEVAGVLGHEVAHITERHSLRNIVGSLGIILLVQTFLGDASGLIAIATEGGTALLTQSFSREFEREADEVGWQFLVDARISPQGLIRFLKRLEEQSKESGFDDLERLTAFMSTHPYTGDRIAMLEKKYDSLPSKEIFQKISLDFDSLKNSIRSINKTESETSPPTDQPPQNSGQPTP